MTDLARRLGTVDATAIGPGSMLGGGTYVYGRERLGPWWGFTSGWGSSSARSPAPHSSPESCS